MKNISQNILRRVSLGALLVLGGVYIGMQVKDVSPLAVFKSEAVRQKDPSYPLISSLLECNVSDGVSNKYIKQMKDMVTGIIETAAEKKDISRASIYFRDLTNGPTFGVNDLDPFAPGSLLKIPVLMSLYKKAETNPKFLDEKIIFTKEPIATRTYFPEPERLVSGTEYTNAELVRRMIEYSDNDAALLLGDSLGLPALQESFTDLGIDPPNGSDYFVSVKVYASFLRILYNSTYLNKDYSEKALELMTKSSFDKGLRAGLPTDIILAHKYGERFVTDDGEKQLHDCGIVYHPVNPYLVCVMTRGQDFDKLADFIHNISAAVYQMVDADARENKSL